MKSKVLLLWFRIIRPQTLFASICPVIVSLYLTGIQRPFVALLTGLCSLSLQVLSNLINDYYDFKRGTDKKARVGFRRALAEGEVSEKAMRNASFITLGLAMLMGAYLMVVGGWPIVIIGLTAILFAWLYTATSHSLSYLGIADIFTFTYYGIFAAWGTGILQGVEVCSGDDTTHLFSANILNSLFYAGAVSGLISMSVLMINNLRDYEDDKLAGKHTPVVRLGVPVAKAFLLFYDLLIPVFAYLAFPASPAWLVVVPCLLVYVLILKANGVAYNKCLVFTGLLNVVYALLAALSW